MIATHLRKIIAIAIVAAAAFVPHAVRASLTNPVPTSGPTDSSARPIVNVGADSSGVRTAPGTPGAQADNVQPATYTVVSGSLSATGSVVSTLGTAQSALITLNASAFVGSVIFEESDGGTNWYTVPGIRSDLSSYFTAATSFSGAFSYAYEPQIIPGATAVRARVTAYTSGTVSVAIIPSALAALPQLLGGVNSVIGVSGNITAGNNSTVLSNGTLAAATPSSTFAAGNGAHTMSWYASFTASAAGSLSVQCSTSGTTFYQAVSPGGTADTYTWAAAGSFSTQFAVQPCKTSRVISTVALTAVYLEDEYGL